MQRHENSPNAPPVPLDRPDKNPPSIRESRHGGTNRARHHVVSSKPQETNLNALGAVAKPQESEFRWAHRRAPFACCMSARNIPAEPQSQL